MNEIAKAMAINVECIDCKARFSIESDKITNKITHKREFNVNGRSIFLTYYDCPKCGKRNFVQIDDVKSKQEFARISVEFMKLASMTNKGKTIPRKRSERFKKARQHLSEYRTTLMKEFTGKSIHDDETGMDFELRFNV